MKTISNSLGRTIVVILGTLIGGSTLMLAALGPGMAQASPIHAAAPRA